MEDTKNTPANEVAPQEVETQSEQVAPTEESAQAPAETAEDTPKQSDNWETRYKDLQSKFTKTAQEKAELERFTQQISQQAPQEGHQPQDSPFDAETSAGIQAIADARADARYEARKAHEFAQKHADELKDRLLSATVKDIIAEQNANGLIIDQEVALSEAKKLLDARIKPQVKEAQVAGVKEGEELSRNKGQLGAVGESGKQPEVDPSKLSAKEFAKYHGLEYSE